MTLDFGAASSSVIFSIGNVANASNGAVTFMGLYRPNFGGTTNTGVLAVQSGASERRSLTIDASSLFGDQDFSSGFPITGTAGDFLWIGLSKPAGSAHFRMHWKNQTTGGAWTHGESVGAGNHADPGVSNQINVGSDATSASGNGGIAVGGIWNSELSDPAIQAACTAALSDFMAANPNWAARFMNSAPSSIQDLTGGGGNETSRTGTVTNTADPAGYNFALTSTTEYGTPQSKTPPGRGRSPQTARLWLPRPRFETTSAQVSTGSATANVRPVTAAAGTKSVSGAASSGARVSTVATGLKGASGAATASVRPATTDTGRKNATGTSSASVRPSSQVSGAKNATGAGLGSAHPSTSASTATVPGGPAAASARISTIATGRKGATGAAAAAVRPATRAAGVHGAIGMALASVRPATLGAGRKGAIGTGRVIAHNATSAGVPPSSAIPAADWSVGQGRRAWEIDQDNPAWLIGQAGAAWKISQG